MFRTCFLCTVALLALAGCVPAQPVVSTTGAPAPVMGLTEASLPTPELTHDEDLSDTPFILRNFPPELETVFKDGALEILTGIRDDNLQGFRCTHSYVDSNPSGEPQLHTVDEASKIERPLRDEMLVGLVASITGELKDPEYRVGAISACETETQQFVLYSRGNLGYRPYIGVVDAGKVVEIAAPDVEDVYLATCQQALAVDKSNNLYYQCSGGDGPGRQYALYRVNLNSHEDTRLVYCRQSPDQSFCR